ncbi:hypothetical protein D6833_09345 [Candidatus Parcubacteria bacterium]|nr:MAG: hypothetical protein D6833_09345 [Candidatus Parcubacteria bacterium]
MALVTDLVSDVLVSAPEAPEPLVTRHYLRAVRTFCRSTGAWRDDLGVLFDGKTSDYAINVPLDSEAFDASMCKVGDRVLGKASREQMLYRYRATASGRPQVYRVSASRLIFAPDPAEDISSNVVVTAWLRPVLSATNVPDALVEEHHDEGFVPGALATLLLTPNAPWRDADMAVYYLRKFDDYVARWRSVAADGGNTGVPRRVRYGGY